MAAGAWLDAAALRARLRELPTGELGNDIADAAKEECLKHLGAEGITPPADDAVTSSQRIAQTLFARTIMAERATNPDGENAGIDSQIPLFSFRKRARDLLGYKLLGIG